MAFSLQPVGKDAERPGQLTPQISLRVNPRPPGLSTVKALIPVYRLHLEIRVALQEMQHRALILLRGKGTGRIDHPASGL